MKFTVVALILCTTIFGCKNKTSINDKFDSGHLLQREKDTLYIEDFSNGKHKIIAMVKNDKLNGLLEKFGEDGKLIESGNMYNGFKNGLWKKFDSKRTVFEVKQFENGSLKYTLDPADFQFKTINLKKIQLAIPKFWQIETDKPEGILLVTYKRSTSNIKFRPNMVIAIDNSNEKFSRFLSKNIPRVLQQSGQSQVLHGDSIHLDGKEAFSLEFLSNQKGILIGNIYTFIKIDNNVFTIIQKAEKTNTDKFTEYQAVFEEIINSFKYVSD